MSSHRWAPGYNVLQASCLVLALLGPLACTSTEPRSNDRVQVSVSGEATLVADASTGGVTATIPLAITNSGTTSVRYYMCGNSLDRSTGAGWENVWGQICSLSASALVGGPPEGVDIGPGEVFTTEVQVATWLGQGWSEPLSGDYRFSAGIFTATSTVPAELRMSAPFRFQIQQR